MIKTTDYETRYCLVCPFLIFFLTSKPRNELWRKRSSVTARHNVSHPQKAIHYIRVIISNMLTRGENIATKLCYSNFGMNDDSVVIRSWRPERFLETRWIAGRYSLQ
jgi:hypothetical protein